MRILRRILVGLLAVLAALVLFGVASIALDGLLNRDRLSGLANERIPGQAGGPDVAAYVARPTGSGPFPAVILIHEFYGLNPSITGKAEGLAQEGYLVVAPDTFRGSTTAWVPRAIYQVITSRPEQVNQDLDSVFAWLEAQPAVDAERIAVMGFCYGGRASLTYSLHNPRLAATAIFYGSPETDPAVLRSLPGPVLGIFGGADASIPMAEVRQFETGLQAAGIPHEISVYEGQPHAFVTDMQGIRAGGAQGQAWDQLLAFLEHNLRPVEPGARLAPAGSDYRAPFAFGYYARLAWEHAFGSAAAGHPH